MEVEDVGTDARGAQAQQRQIARSISAGFSPVNDFAFVNCFGKSRSISLTYFMHTFPTNVEAVQSLACYYC